MGTRAARDARGIRDAAARAMGRRADLEAAGTDTGWPVRVALWRPTQAEMGRDVAAFHALQRDARAIAALSGSTLESERRRLGRGRVEDVARAVVVPDVDALARVAGGAWPGELGRRRERASRLREAFPALSAADVARVLAATARETDAAFATLAAASAWLAGHGTCGLRAREVPIPGVSGKWLEAHEAVVESLTGRPLGLARDPWMVTWRLLDPAHAADEHALVSGLPGRMPAVPYDARCAVIVENWSSFVNFPELEGAVCVWGQGRASVSVLPEVPWLASCPDVAYWGDMDADGLEILDSVRAHGVRCRSILMDADAMARYDASCGTDVGPDGRPIRRVPHAVGHLEGGELELYRGLTGQTPWTMHLRVEQERIPLADALAALRKGERHGEA